MPAEAPTWHKEAKKLIPTWNTTQPITYRSLFRTVYDVNGRPFDENRHDNIAGVPFDFVPGLRDGGRHLFSVNKSAFDEVARVYPEAKGVISYFREAIQPYRTKTTVGGIESVITSVIGLPVWMVYRADNPVPNGEIPPYITSAAKVARGGISPYSLAMSGDLIGLQRRDRPLPVTKQDFMASVYAENLLLNKTDRVVDQGMGEACPAPRVMIEEFAEVLFERPTSNMVTIRDRLRFSRQELQRIRAFGNALNQGSLMTKVLEGVMEIPEYVASIANGQMIEIAGIRNRVDIIKLYVDIMNSVNKKLNVALGRQIPPPITRQDVIRDYNGSALGLKRQIGVTYS